MHIKHMHEMIEKLAECTKKALEENKTYIGDYPIGDVVEMLKELNEAEYYARIAKAMEKEEEDEKEEEKYMLNRLKEEYKDEYRQMEERYGEEADRRFYDSWRHADGTFAKKGTGSYRPRSSGRRGRRGYVEPPYLHMPYDYRYDMDDYDYADAERDRDLDRRSMNRLYFSEPMGGRNMTDSRSGERMDGYGNMGRNVPNHDSRDGRSWQSRRGYMEAKESHSDNTPESKQAKMRELEKYMRELSEDITEMIEGASNEEKTMLRAKVQTLAQKIQ